MIGRAATPAPPGARSRVLVGLLVLCTLGGLAAIISDGAEIVRVLTHSDWHPIPFALVGVGLSYLTLSAALVAVSELIGVKAPRPQLLRAAFISEVLNHVISLGGVAGYSLRTAVVTRLNVRAGDILAMSLLHSYFNNLGLALLVGLGIAVLTSRSVLTTPWAAVAVLLGVSIATFSAASTAALFSERVRTRLIRGSTALIRRLPRAWRPGSERLFADLDAALARGAHSIRQRPARAVLPILLIGAHWCAALAAFWFCLDAFGEAATLPVAVSGFSIGVAAGFVAVVPGGLGVQEAALVGANTVLGIPLEHAALAAILFRVLYYFVPYLFSLTMYARAAREGSAPESATA